MTHPSRLLMPFLSGRTACAIAAVLLICTVLPAYAHHLPLGMEDVDEFEDMAAFTAGLRHPFLGMDHWLFAVVAGALAGLGSMKKHVAVVGAVFTASLALGAWLGTADVILPDLALSSWMTLSAAVMVLVLSQKLPLSFQMVMLGVAALWQGNDHGVAWPVDAAAPAYLSGLVVTSVGLAAAGTLVVRAALSARRAADAEASSL